MVIGYIMLKFEIMVPLRPPEHDNRFTCCPIKKIAGDELRFSVSMFIFFIILKYL